MSRIKTLILWGRGDGLGEGILRLLSVKEGWKLVQVESCEDITILIQAINRESPDVVIIHQGNQFNDTQLPLQIIHQYPQIRVIVMSLENNSVEVYNRHEVNIKGVDDLFSAIED